MNNNADNKPGVMIYFDIIPLIEGMSPDDAGQLFLAILKYAQYGEIPSLSGFALAVWPFVKSLVDRDSQRYDLVRKKKQWAVYCREAKRRGETPLELEAWIIESERSPAINTDNHSSSPIIGDDVCYPTTTPAPAPTTATTPTTTTSPISSTADRGLGGRNTSHMADYPAPAPNRPPSALGGDYAVPPEDQWEHMRQSASDMLAGYPR